MKKLPKKLVGIHISLTIIYNIMLKMHTHTYIHVYKLKSILNLTYNIAKNAYLNQLFIMIMS